jgi:hypothetical protein
MKRNASKTTHSAKPVRGATRGPHEAPWLLLVHQLPPKPAYFRAKVSRRLHRIGAVPLKSTVYILPRNDATLEDFQWLAKEIVAEGGDATLCIAAFVDGVSDAEVRALFQRARELEFSEITADALRLANTRNNPTDEQNHSHEFSRLRKRWAEVVAIDFFETPARAIAKQALLKFEVTLRGAQAGVLGASTHRGKTYAERTWVTRTGVQLDRIASAWLIARFIDPSPCFKFVDAKNYRPLARELRFDMFDAEFGHEGDACTFEVLRRRFRIDTRGIQAVAEIVHDIDIKDDKFGRPEAAGVISMIEGCARQYASDDDRLKHGFVLLDMLLAFFQAAE